MEQSYLELASTIVSEGQPLTLEALARRAGVSRSTAHRRTGGLNVLVQALESRGVDPESTSIRSRLLTAARSALARRGVVSVTVETIAGEAGVSPVSVYRLFGDRNTLLREALADVFPRQALHALDWPESTLDEALLAVAASIIRFAGNYPGLTALMLVPSSAERAELMQLHGVQQDLRSGLHGLLERHATAGTIGPGDTHLRVGLFSGLCLGASLLLGEMHPVEEQDVLPRAQEVLRVFMAALGDAAPTKHAGGQP